ncbi:MAG: FAD:protein FMN transferase [Acidimicrobiales bacterium]
MRSADYAMGGLVTFDVRPGPCPPGEAERALGKARTLLQRADEIFGTWRPDSPVSRLRRDEITLAHAPPEVAEVLWRCADARRISSGWFDPWGAQGGVDPTGIVRGWAADGALGLLRRAGVRAARVDAGTVVAAFGEPQPGLPWRMDLVDGCAIRPEAGAGQETMAVATAPAGAHASRWTTVKVTGPDPVLAEALMAAVVAAGPHEGLAVVDRVPGFGAAVVAGDGRVRATPGLMRVAAGDGSGARTRTPRPTTAARRATFAA